jgi:hypothetical protein
LITLAGQLGPFPLPSFIGVKGVHWEVVMSEVKNPAYLWAVWKPKDVSSYESLRDVWNNWDRDRPDSKGVRPPLKEVEKRFKAKWRPNDAVSSGSLPLMAFSNVD